MASFLHGVKVPHRKNTENMTAVKMPVGKIVSIPTVMHIGAPANVVVKAGDLVKVGTLIAEANGYVSSNIYSSVSGKVLKIEDKLLSNGRVAPSVVIESDGEMTVDEGIKPYEITSKEDLIKALRLSGIVGLGGAGFPTFVKFDTDKAVDELIINGAECEPYITSDSLTMVEKTDYIEYAIQVITKFIDIKRVIIGIEKNKPKAIGKMRQLADRNPIVSIKLLPSIYPQGAEKVLVYHTIGKVIGQGKLPLDVGAIVSNCTTMASIGEFLKTGMPLVEKCVTVDGDAVAKPQNVIVPIGTSVSDVFEFCSGFKKEPKKVLYGGPMMGISVPDMDVPVIKNTNAILAFSEKMAFLPKTTACIRCGRCLNTCPFGINPAGIEKAFKRDDLDAAEKFGVALCMECGCCSFVCPANRPLVQTNKMAKATLLSQKKGK
ncbi:MAG: electron transport complex subunit RsxC [Clostridia bacterium]|nr:electron transport complex subunit RsxC [Clostridia bacterium]